MQYSQNSTLALLNNQTEKSLQFIESIKDNYSFTVRDFCRWIRSNNLELNFESIRGYIIHINDSDLSASTKRLKKQAVKSAIKRLMRNSDITTLLQLDRALKQLDEDIETKSPGINSRAVTKDKIITEFEYCKLLDSIKSEKQKRFIEFLFNTGCRVSEMLNIRLKDIEIKGNLAYIKVKGKGSKKVKYKVRTIFIPVQMLDDIQNTFKGDKYLFSTSTGNKYSRNYISSEIKKVGKKHLNKKITAHSMRHSFATLQIKHTGNIKGISKYLGHSSVSITLDMYCHIELEEEEILSVYYNYKNSA